MTGSGVFVAMSGPRYRSPAQCARRVAPLEILGPLTLPRGERGLNYALRHAQFWSLSVRLSPVRFRASCPLPRAPFRLPSALAHAQLSLGRFGRGGRVRNSEVGRTGAVRPLWAEAENLRERIAEA